jgi:hypothetical protein
MTPSLRRFLPVLAVLLLAPELHAQLTVQLRVSRRLYVAYEPIVATLQITNLTGRDITLHDADNQNWLGFRIRTTDDRLVPPRDVNYQVGPISIGAGQTLKRSLNLVSLYPVTDMGLYRAQASIYFPDLQRFFSSAPVSFEVSEGKLIWQQTVGVPEGQEGAGGYRTYSLLSFRQPKDNMLYVRTEDERDGIVYSTYPVGRLLTENPPQYLLDLQNQLHILQLVGPKTFTYTRIGPNGQLLGQTTYTELKKRPRLHRDATGKVAVTGGQQEVPIAQSSGGLPAPKLSDRPPGLPK